MQAQLRAARLRSVSDRGAFRSEQQSAVRTPSRQSRCARRASGQLRATGGDGPPEAGEPQQPRQESDLRLPLAGSDTDWRAFRARLVAGEGTPAAAAAEAPAGDEPSTSGREADGELWAHPIAQPEKGCLLLAHPLMFNSAQQYFNQAVILIISHDDQGTAGILLNKPLEHLIGQLSGAEALLPEFGANRLLLGGDVGGGGGGRNVMQLLHGHGATLEGSKEVVPGVYLGGFQAAKLAVRQGRLPASDFRWYCRYCGWAPGQLQAECDKGVWFLAAASPAMILHPSSLENGRRTWHQVLQGMRGEYRQLSDALLVDAAAREEVWGRTDYLKSSQGGVPGPEGGDGQ